MGDKKMLQGNYLYWGMVASTILMILMGGSLSADDRVALNLMIDINSPASPTSEQNQIAFDSIANLTNSIGPRSLNVTLFPTGEAILSQRLHITYLANASNYEVAMGGMKKDERIGSMSASDQGTLLGEMKRYVEACHICRGKTISPQGFKPQSFDQNQDTYAILEKMGMLYDAGFQAGAIYLSGHENDTWPYRINGLNVYAVPVSTFILAGERTLLSDRTAKEKKLSGSQWYGTLVDKFDQSAKNGDPMVVIFDNHISGIDTDYLNAYRNFIDFALSKNATFVTTSQLVEMSKTGKQTGKSTIGAGSAVSAERSGCIACDALNNSDMNVTMENRTAPADVEVSITPSFED